MTINPMLPYGEQGFTMQINLLAVGQKQDAKHPVLVPQCPMEGVGCTGARVPVRELQKVSRKVKKQTGNMAGGRLQQFSKGRSPWWSGDN